MTLKICLPVRMQLFIFQHAKIQNLIFLATVFLLIRVLSIAKNGQFLGVNTTVEVKIDEVNTGQ